MAESNSAERESNRINESVVELIEKTIHYSDYSTVNWLHVDTMFYRTYNCDWQWKFPDIEMDYAFPSLI